MPVRITNLNTQQCNALRAAGEGIVISVDNDTKTAIVEGTVSQAIAAIQAQCDEIREKDGAKAQSYRSLVGVRNRLDSERELAEQGKSKTVEIVPNGVNVKGAVPSVLDGVPVVTGAKAEPPTTRRVNGGDKSADVKPALTAKMRGNFADLAKNADTPAAREYWRKVLDALPADEPSELLA